jgi:P27 family predicted phage terminase small subunit
LNGNAAKRPLNAREPQPKVGTPHCPEWLTDESKKVWKRLVSQLRAMKVLTLADADAIAMYSHTYVRWRDAEDFVSKHGFAYPLRDEKGQVRCFQQFPQVAIARNLLLVLKSYQAEFGLTPAARSRIAVPGSEQPAGDAHRWLG